MLAVFILFEIIVEVNKCKFIILVIFMKALIILGFILISTTISAVTEDFRLEQCRKTVERREKRKADREHRKAEREKKKQLKEERRTIQEENSDE